MQIFDFQFPARHRYVPWPPRIAWHAGWQALAGGPNSKRKQAEGFSLIELLVVIVLFAIISVIGTQIVTSSLRGTNKSEKATDVRQNIEYAFNVMERQLRSAKSLNCTGVTNKVDYVNADNRSAYFECTAGKIIHYYVQASGPAITNNLTGTGVVVTCTPSIFTCSNDPDVVGVTITAKDATGIGIEAASITTSTEILLRNQ